MRYDIISKLRINKKLIEPEKTLSFSLFFIEIWTKNQLLILAGCILCLLSLLTCTIHFIVKKYNKQTKNSQEIDSIQQNFDKNNNNSDGTTLSTGSSSNGQNASSLHSNNNNHNFASTYSAFTPYRQSVGNSLTILQTSPPWVVDLNTGQDLLIKPNNNINNIPKTSPVRMVDCNFYTHKTMQNMVKTLPIHDNLEKTQFLNKSGNMVVEI